MGERKIYVVFGLHCHQPWWQMEEVFERIHRDCYLPLSQWLAENITSTSSGRATPLLLHLSGSLIELCEEHSLTEFLSNVGEAAASGHVILMGGGYHHPILPRIPWGEAVRQLFLHRRRHQEVFGVTPTGLFPPEMAYDLRVVELARVFRLGWVLADDLPFATRYEEVPRNWVASHRRVPVLLRSRLWSNRIAFWQDGSEEEFAHWLVADLLDSFPDRPQYVVLMMDGETFGGHLDKGGQPVEHFFKLMEALHSIPEVEFVSPQRLLEIFPFKEREVPAGSWSTSEDDIAKGIPYPLWDDPENPAHQLLWELTELAYQVFVDAGGPKELRDRMGCAWNSCKWWWLSRDHWAPHLIEEEIRNLLAIIECSRNPEVHNQEERILASLYEVLLN